MATRNIIVIGASAGGVQALSKLVSQLPADLPAAVFIVLHIPFRRSQSVSDNTRATPDWQSSALRKLLLGNEKGDIAKTVIQEADELRVS